ncbi:MAG: response regulator [Longimonas sp.]|uniref:response regulator n=1 Tax=Longimonas sp. TaxID=2039626 RepID=UPI0033598B9E
MSHPSILLLDDDDFIVRLVSHQLSTGYALSTCQTCSAARRSLQETPFDVLLLDVQLPNGSGCDVLHSARTHPESLNTETPAIAFTAHVLGDIRERLLDEGFDAYLAKPFHAAQLVGTIESLLPA